METNPYAKAVILEVVDNQIRDNTPPETRQTFARLLEEGYDEDEARRLIGCALVSEIWAVLKQRKPYNQTRYVAALQKLPALPE